jgi:hypothetical protein
MTAISREHTVKLPDDGAPYRCGFRAGWDPARQSGTCDKPALVGLSELYYRTHLQAYMWRSVCGDHAPKEPDDHHDP